MTGSAPLGGAFLFLQRFRGGVPPLSIRALGSWSPVGTVQDRSTLRFGRCWASATGRQHPSRQARPVSWRSRLNGRIERVHGAGSAVTFAAVPQARRRIKFFAKLLGEGDWKKIGNAGSGLANRQKLRRCKAACAKKSSLPSFLPRKRRKRRKRRTPCLGLSQTGRSYRK